LILNPKTATPNPKTAKTINPEPQDRNNRKITSVREGFCFMESKPGDRYRPGAVLTNPQP
jgi:hypothetical protein